MSVLAYEADGRDKSVPTVFARYKSYSVRHSAN